MHELSRAHGWARLHVGVDAGERVSACRPVSTVAAMCGRIHRHAASHRAPDCQRPSAATDASNLRSYEDGRTRSTLRTLLHGVARMANLGRKALWCAVVHNCVVGRCIDPRGYCPLHRSWWCDVSRTGDPKGY